MLCKQSREDDFWSVIFLSLNYHSWTRPLGTKISGQEHVKHTVMENIVWGWRGGGIKEED